MEEYDLSIEVSDYLGALYNLFTYIEALTIEPSLNDFEKLKEIVENLYSVLDELNQQLKKEHSIIAKKYFKLLKNYNELAKNTKK